MTTRSIDQPQTIVTFDCYGTLIDWQTGILQTLHLFCERVGITQPPSDAELLDLYAQAEKQAESGPFKIYKEVLGEVMTTLTGRLGVPLPVADRRLLADSVRSWTPFGDTRGALKRLKDAGVIVGVLSNVDRDLFATTQQKLGVTLDLIVLAEDVQSYKPGQAHFESALNQIRAMGMQPSHWIHAAESLRHDIAPASAMGVRSVWINRNAGGVSASGNTAPGLDYAGVNPGTESYPDLNQFVNALLQGIE